MGAVVEKQAFAFDTEFDDRGVVVRASQHRPMRRAYAPQEVETMIAQARDEARATALAEVESMRARALAEIAQAVGQAMPGLAHAAHAHREQSGDLAMTAARVVAGAAMDRFPEGPLRSALEVLGQEIDASPRLVIRAGALDQAGRDALERACADSGFSGAVAWREEPDLPAAAFRLEWADGRADFDPADAFARMDEALKSALAAEAGHAEPLVEGDV